LAVRTLLPVDGFGLEIGVGSGKFAESLGIKPELKTSRKMIFLLDELFLYFKV
jgi:hypothetical protein